MSGPFKMKNSALAASAKYKSPIPYASPAKGGIVETLKSGYNKAKKFAGKVADGVSNIDLTPGYAGNPQFPDIPGDFKRGYNKSEKNQSSEGSSKNTKKDKTSS